MPDKIVLTIRPCPGNGLDDTKPWRAAPPSPSRRFDAGVAGPTRCSVDHRAIGNERALEPLEHPPSDRMRGKCRRSKRGGLVGDRSTVGRFYVDLGHPFGHHEPSDRFLHGPADREQAVVAQDAAFLVAERRGDAFPAIDRKHLDFLIVEKRLIEYESTRLLTESAERRDVGRPWRAVGGVGVRCADDIGTGSEQRMVNVVTRGVDGTGRVAVGIFHFATGPDQHQPVDRRFAEGDAPVEQPEMIGKYRITGGYVAVAEHTPAQRAEDTVSERAHPFAVRPFFGKRTDSAIGLDAVKRRIGIRRYLTHDMSRNLVSCLAKQGTYY